MSRLYPVVSSGGGYAAVEQALDSACTAVDGRFAVYPGPTNGLAGGPPPPFMRCGSDSPCGGVDLYYNTFRFDITSIAALVAPTCVVTFYMVCEVLNERHGAVGEDITLTVHTGDDVLPGLYGPPATTYSGTTFPAFTGAQVFPGVGFRFSVDISSAVASAIAGSQFFLFLQLSTNSVDPDRGRAWYPIGCGFDDFTGPYIEVSGGTSPPPPPPPPPIPLPPNPPQDTLFNKRMRQRRAGVEYIPLIEITMAADRYTTDEVTRTIWLAQKSYPDFCGRDWQGVISRWSPINQGLVPSGGLEITCSNVTKIQGKKLSEWLRIGSNAGFDTTMWDATVYLAERRASVDDIMPWQRLILEEVNSVTDNQIVLRFSGVEPYIEALDGAGSNDDPLVGSTVRVVDAQSAGFTIGVTNAPSLLINCTGSDRLALFAICVSNHSVVGDPTSVLTDVGTPVLLTSALAPADNTKLFLYYMINPPQGTVTITATWASEPHPPPPGTGYADKIIGGLALTGVNQMTPFRLPAFAGTGSDHTPTSHPSSDRSELMVDAMSVFFDAGLLPNAIVGAGQVSEVNRSDAGVPGGTGDRFRLGMSTKIGVRGTGSMTWALDISGAPQNRNWCDIGVSIKPSAT
jgi:hypothetical protein